MRKYQVLGRNYSFLLPGEFAVQKGDQVLATLLGSCVAISLHDPELSLGGLCHYLLPHPPKNAPLPLALGKYGSLVLPQLLQGLLDQGADKKRLQAKLFGGAGMFSNPGMVEGEVGQSNLALARNWLQGQGLRLAGEGVGGKQGRRIYFDLANGLVTEVTTTWQQTHSSQEQCPVCKSPCQSGAPCPVHGPAQVPTAVANERII